MNPPSRSRLYRDPWFVERELDLRERFVRFGGRGGCWRVVVNNGDQLVDCRFRGVVAALGDEGQAFLANIDVELAGSSPVAHFELAAVGDFFLFHNLQALLVTQRLHSYTCRIQIVWLHIYIPLFLILADTCLILKEKENEFKVCIIVLCQHMLLVLTFSPNSPSI